MCDSNYWLDLEMGGNGLHHHCINDKEQVADLICKEQLPAVVDLTLEKQISTIVDERVGQVLDVINQSNDKHNKIHAIIDSHFKNYYERFKQQDRNNKNLLDRLNEQVVINRNLMDRLNVLTTIYNETVS